MKFAVFLLAVFVGAFCSSLPHLTPSNEPAVNGTEKDCDPMGRLRPCRCEVIGLQTLICSGLDNERELLSVLTASRSTEYKIEDFFLVNSTLRYLPSDAFNGLKLLGIEIVSSTLSALTDSDLAFVGLEHTFIGFKMNKTTLQSEWDWSIFRNLTSMKNMIVLEGSIHYLDMAPEDSPTFLNSVHMVNSGIDTLHPEVLRNYHNMYMVSFAENHIRDIKRTMFPTPALKLTAMFFDYNEIEDIPEDMFTDMPVLEYIGLYNNKLLTFNEKTFSILTNPKLYLGAGGNYVECDCRLRWILKKTFKVYAHCRSPLELQDKQVQELKPEDLVCLS